MVSVLLIWIYIFFTTFFSGGTFLSLISGKEKCSQALKLLQPEDHCLCGIMLATVYSQIFSLFYKVGLIANIVLLFISAISVIFLIRQKTVSSLFTGSFDKKKTYVTIVLFILTIIMAYACSRGYFHYDSNLYHGQSIRWIEEYGVVKGLALLHCRLGYNSASFALSALYSFSFLGGRSFHTVQGFLALLLLIKCLRIFHVFTDKEIRISDFARIGGFYYIFNVFDEIVAPASDYFAMVTFIFCIIKAVDIYELCEKDPSLQNEEAYVFPALLSVYIPTVKLSTAPAVLLISIPVFMLISAKKIRKLMVYATLSLLIALPLFFRNLILSGRILYPSTAFDIFDPEWKIPADIAILDSDYIVGFGRGYNFPEAAEYPFFQWFPHWLQSLGKTDMLFFLLCLASILILPVSILLRKGFKPLHVVELTAIAAFLFWLTTSPLVRYGMGFLLLLPPLMFGDLATIIIEKNKAGSISKLIKLCFPYALLAFLAFKCIFTIKYMIQNADAPYYIVQQDYDEFDCMTENVDGMIVYLPTDGDQTGYYCFPSTPELIDGLHLAGEDIKDGFILR